MTTSVANDRCLTFFFENIWNIQNKYVNLHNKQNKTMITNETDKLKESLEKQKGVNKLLVEHIRKQEEKINYLTLNFIIMTVAWLICVIEILFF